MNSDAFRCVTDGKCFEFGVHQGVVVEMFWKVNHGNVLSVTLGLVGGPQWGQRLESESFKNYHISGRTAIHSNRSRAVW